METYDSVLVAEYMLSIAKDRNIELNVTKTQKMLYIIYGYYLANYNNHQIFTENPQAWPFGPVFARSQKKVDYTNVLPLDSSNFDKIREDKILTELIITVVEKYYKYSASKLSEWSHEKNGPWHKATQQEGFKWSTPIPNSLIQTYFKQVTV